MWWKNNISNLLPTLLKIDWRLWKSWHFEIKQESIQLDFWIQKKIFSRFDHKREHQFINFCIYLLYVLPTNHWNDCIHIMVKSLVSVFLSHTQAYLFLWSTCSEGQLVWLSVLRCRWCYMREAGSCWRTEGPQCFIIPRESDPTGHSTHTGLILERLISSQESFMCVGVSSRVLCCS